MNPRKKAFALQILRRGSYKWAPRNEALRRARVSRGIYKCAICETLVPNKQKDLDHVVPVVPVEGWDNFDGVIDRLYAELEGWQVICKPCHALKTGLENSVRVVERRAKKTPCKKRTKKV